MIRTAAFRSNQSTLTIPAERSIRGWWNFEINMKQHPLNYSEGDWFAVPIGNQFVIGRIVRAGAKGRVLFGYFFGSALSTAPSESELGKLIASKPMMRAMFG